MLPPARIGFADRVGVIDPPVELDGIQRLVGSVSAADASDPALAAGMI